jgi:Xaa-Pro aminopeptidase
MTVTDEPGIYIAGRFGVRIENTLIVVPYMETGFGRFLQFEPLTLCPIDTAPIISEMLTDEEKRWLDDYHARVFGTLSPFLEAEEADWLRRATSPIGLYGFAAGSMPAANHLSMKS